MSEDQQNLKENPREAVKTAIQALRSKGAEINPYTVAAEAKLPRSAIYRNAELMDLISREKMEPTEKLAPTSDAFSDRVAELESEVEKLGQQIWNLEKQNEDLQKDFNDAWNMGFAAGLEEAAKRYARGPLPAGSPQPMSEMSPWPSVERNLANQAAADAFLSGAVQHVASVIGATSEQVFSANESPADVEDSPLIIDFSLSSERDSEAEAAEEAPPVPPPQPTKVPGLDRRAQIDTGPMKAAEVPAASLGTETATDIMPLNAQGTISTKIEGAKSSAAPPAVAASVGEPVARTGRQTVISDHVIFADNEETEMPYFSDEMSLTSAQELLYSPEILQALNDQSTFAEQAPDGLESKASHVPAENLENSQRAPASPHTQTHPTHGSNFAAMGVGPRSAAAAVALATRHDYQATGIYNVARSGPYVASDFNPLIELSWKDIEDVYNYRASTLKDYAKNVPSAPTSFDNLVPPVQAQPRSGSNNGAEAQSHAPQTHDAQIVLPSDEEIAKLQELETAMLMGEVEAAVFMSEEETEIKDEPLRTDEREAVGFGRPPQDDPNRTGDRLQAMPSARFVDDAGVVDLDALDIFDNLDEWIDVNKLGTQEAMAPAKAAAAPAESADPGAEYRELIKNRYKQASEMGAEQKAPLTSKPAEPSGAHPASGGGLADSMAPRAPRNKFVGGKASQEAAPPPQPTFVAKQVPPEIRKACLILGVRQEELTQQIVMESWKRQIVEVHPDKGGDHEAAIYLNTAKETLIRWLDQQAPKLGAKFKKKDEK